MLKKLRQKNGSSILQMPFILMMVLVMVAFFMQTAPIFMAKQQLDTFADELCRQAEISGRVGQETDEKAEQLTDATGLSPQIKWSTQGKIQLGEDISVKLTLTKDLGFFIYGHYPVQLTAVHKGRSEMYWKK